MDGLIYPLIIGLIFRVKILQLIIKNIHNKDIDAKVKSGFSLLNSFTILNKHASLRCSLFKYFTLRLLGINRLNSEVLLEVITSLTPNLD